MYELFLNGKYGAINTAYSTTIVYYVVKFLPEPYALQGDKTVDKQAITAGELIVKEEYLSGMKTNTKWYCQQLKNKYSVIIETCTLVHTGLYVSTINFFRYTQKFMQ